MMMVVKNCIRYVVQNKHNKAMAERLVDVICLLPKDLMTMVMMEIFHNQRKLHNILCDFDKYLDTFDALDKLIDKFIFIQIRKSLIKDILIFYI